MKQCYHLGPHAVRLLFRDETRVCSVHVRPLCDSVCEQDADLVFQNEDPLFSLESICFQGFEHRELVNLIAKLRNLLQSDHPLSFSDYRGNVLLEISATEVMADVFPVTITFRGSFGQQFRDGYLSARYGGSMILEWSSTTRESLSRFLDLLKAEV